MKHTTMKRTLSVAMLLALANAAALGGRPTSDTGAGSNAEQAVQVMDSEEVLGGGDWKKWVLCAACVGAGIAAGPIGPVVASMACGFICGYAAASAWIGGLANR